MHRPGLPRKERISLDSKGTLRGVPFLRLAGEEHRQSVLFLQRQDQKFGAGDRDRTGDIQLGKLAFYR